MLRKLLLATGSLVILGMVPAVAQNDTQSGSASGSKQDATQGSDKPSVRMKASDVTCREINAIDTQRVAGVLYFLHGYSEGERSAMGSSSNSASATGSDDGSSTSNKAANSDDSNGQSAQGSSASDANQTASSTAGADANQAASSKSGANADQTASTSGSAGGSSDMTNQSGETTGSTQSPASGGTAVITAVPGFYEIPVEQTLVACSSEPDSKASDVIDRQRGGSDSDSDSSNPQ